MAQTYEVIYLDKFSDAKAGESGRAKLRHKFGLNQRALNVLCSGVPVVVKKDVSLDEARKFEQAIKESGGVCWIQEATRGSGFHERRSLHRRDFVERRALYRGSAILPDRRLSIGRRTQDQTH